jgi:hypothetical protein
VARSLHTAGFVGDTLRYHHAWYTGQELDWPGESWILIDPIIVGMSAGVVLLSRLCVLVPDSQSCAALGMPAIR